MKFRLWPSVKLSHVSAFARRHCKTEVSDGKSLLLSITFPISIQFLAYQWHINSSFTV